MGLCFNSGPKWADDILNDLNIESIEANAKEMFGSERSLYYAPDYSCRRSNSNHYGYLCRNTKSIKEINNALETNR